MVECMFVLIVMVWVHYQIGRMKYNGGGIMSLGVDGVVVFGVKSVKNAEAEVLEQQASVLRLSSKALVYEKEIEEIRRRIMNLHEQIGSFPDVGSALHTAKLYSADAFGSSTGGLLLLQKKGKWFKVVHKRDGTAELVEVKDVEVQE